MTVPMTRAVLQAIKEAGRTAYPEEACGFLIGTWDPRRVDEARPTKNVAADERGLRYEIDAAETLRVGTELRGTGRDIVGIFHSHVDLSARPSAQDLERAWEGYSYVIVSVERGRPVDLRAWTLDEPSRTFREVDIQVE